MGNKGSRPDIIREYVRDTEVVGQLTEMQRTNATLIAEFAKIRDRIRSQGLERKIETFDDIKRFDEVAADALIALTKQTETLKMESPSFGFFGLTSTGKSSIINKLIGKDVAEIGAGEITTKVAAYRGSNYTLYDTPGRYDPMSYFNMEYISFWKGLTGRFVVITATLKEMTSVFRIFDALNLKYVILVNRYDHVPNEDREIFKENIRKEIHSLNLKGVQAIWYISSKNPDRFDDWLQMVNYITSTVDESEIFGKTYEARHKPNDIREVNSMVEKSLPYLEKDKISSISGSICEVAGTAVIESDEHSRSIVLGYDQYKLSISADTLVQLAENECLREVDLLLPETELPVLRGKSRKEILDILANGGSEYHEKLIRSLKQLDIEHIVSPYTKNIFVRNFTEGTLTKIGRLVRELRTDLTISGGGPCEYLMFSDNPPEDLPPASNTQEYQQKIAKSHSIQQSNRVRNAKIGVIDSGCSFSLYEEIIARRTVLMPNRMVCAANASRVIETDYRDCYVTATKTGHGTGVVEIIANCLLPGTEIHVANIGLQFGASNVESAMIELYKRDVNVLNCSFVVENSGNLARTLEIIKSGIDGVLVVASVGNRRADRRAHNSIVTSLNDGSTILVGSHNDQNSISTFSVAQCRANICSRGEGVFIASVQPNFRNGTSFAAPHVTATVAIVLSYMPSLAADLIRNLQSSAQHLSCGCEQHGGREVSLKFHPESFVRACLGEVAH